MGSRLLGDRTPQSSRWKSSELRTRLTAFDWRREPVGLYLHVPFCESKCIYCDFNSYAHMEDKFEPFVRALCMDIARGVSACLPAEPECAGAPISSVFFGGGTPSVLSPEQIDRVLNTARERYAISSTAEITLEANPGMTSEANFEGYLRAGINRLSMGVQVLDDVMLKKLGRIHTAEGALKSYRLARSAGFENINLDYMFGLPGQDLAHLGLTLDRLLEVDPPPEHLSFYSLIVEEHTPLYIGVQRGLITVPGEDEVAEMYESVQQRLENVGYSQYEISNFTRGKPCAHNLVYWRDNRYLAFGPGASGYWGDTRYSTILLPAHYIKNVGEGASVVAETELIGPELERGEFMMLGLRLNEGIPLDSFERRFGAPIEDFFSRQIGELTTQGLIESSPEFIRLSVRGRLLGNEVFARFLPD